jgi:hypothetical protein
MRGQAPACWRIARHDNGVGQRAAAFRAAELQVLQRSVTLSGVDDRLVVRSPPVVARLHQTNRHASSPIACCALIGLGAGFIFDRSRGGLYL